ncbi:hypothetical protein MPSEU_000713300 [Mayamaea pseudoterrestris]|nr:hypothetical protein MPSEU_000713300 [Mayamaea pseudoterrestris]
MDSHRFNPMAAAFFSAAAAALLVSSATSCSFLTVLAFPGQVLMNNGSNVQNATMASLGIFCPSDYYDLKEDVMFKLSYVVMCLSLALVILSAILSCSMATIVHPTMLLWRSVAALSAVAAVFSVPVFLLFQTPPCASYLGQQQCSINEGSFLLVGAIVCSVTVTLITQCLDPPLRSVVDEENDGRSKPRHSIQLDDTLVTDASHSTNSRQSLEQRLSHSICYVNSKTQEKHLQDSSQHSSTRSTQIFGCFFPISKEQRSNDKSMATRDSLTILGGSKKWKQLSDDEDDDDVERQQRQAQTAKLKGYKGYGQKQEQAIPWDDEAYFPRGSQEFEHDDRLASTSVMAISEKVPQQPYQYTRNASFDAAPSRNLPDAGRSTRTSVYPPVEQFRNLESIFETSSEAQSTTEQSFSDCHTRQSLRLYSWEDEDDAVDLTGTESILDGVGRGDDSVIEGSAYLENWAMDEIVVKVIKREDKICNVQNGFPPLTQQQSEHALFRLALSFMSHADTASTTATLSQPPRLLKKDPPVSETNDEAVIPRQTLTDMWPPPVRSRTSSIGSRSHVSVADKYGHLISQLRESRSGSFDPPPVDMVTVDACLDEDVSLFATETVPDQSNNWTGGYDVSSRLPPPPSHTKRTGHSVDASESEDVYFSDPDLTVGESTSEPSLESHMSQEEYSEVVVSEVLRRQMRRKLAKKKRRTHSANVSVQSAPSLLNTTIHEETPSDVESEQEEKKSDEPYDPYASIGLERSSSVPDMQSYRGRSVDRSHMLELVHMNGVNKYHLVKTWPRDDTKRRFSARMDDDNKSSGSSGGGVSESKSTDTPERKRHLSPMPLFREDRILRKDLQSVIATSRSTDETVENTSDGSEQQSQQQSPQYARQIRVQRLQDARLRARHIALHEVEGPPKHWLRSSDDTNSKHMDPLAGDNLLASLSQSSLHGSNHHLHTLHHEAEPNRFYTGANGRKADPDGILMTPSFEGSI